MDSDEAPAPPVVSIMETSAEIGEIAKALPKAQAAMGEVFKTAMNPAFRSKYADLASVIEAVVPALNANGITLLQPASFDGSSVSVATMLLHESGQWVRCTLAMPLAKRDAHGIGSATTYSRRYGLQAMSGVAPEDDDGNGAVARKDYGPAPLGADFPGDRPANGGKSSYAAKKDGTSEVFNDLRGQISRVETADLLREWMKMQTLEIGKMPEAWRKTLREDCDERLLELRSVEQGVAA